MVSIGIWGFIIAARKIEIKIMEISTVNNFITLVLMCFLLF